MKEENLSLKIDLEHRIKQLKEENDHLKLSKKIDYTQNSN